MRKGFFEIEPDKSIQPIKRVRKAPAKKAEVDKTKKRFIENLKLQSKQDREETIHQNNPLVVGPFVKAMEETKEIILKKSKQWGFDGIHGSAICPICNGKVQWYWSKAAGFEYYECLDKDCLPWPIGGALRRRVNGEAKIGPTNKKYER